MSNKIIYVTGCYGFIGAHFTRKTLARGWNVFGVDKMTPVASEASRYEFIEHPNFREEIVDIADLSHLYDCDYVVNFAAESHVDNSINDSGAFLSSNILGVANLLELVRNKSGNGNKPVFLQISTDEVYGDILDGAHTEQDILKPSNPYSAAKAAADMLIHAWHRTYGIDYLILRPTNNYGVGQYPEKLIPLSVKNLTRGRRIKLHNDGTPTRNWLHAEDTADAVMTLIDEGAVNDIFNVAGGFEQSNYRTVCAILDAYGLGEDEVESHVDYKYSRDGQDMRYALDDSKLRALGWEPKKVFSEEIQSIVDHYTDIFIW